MSGRQVVFVIPAYNEERSVAKVVRGALAVADRAIVVDDGSGDATARRAADAGAIVARHDANLGQGAALQTGIELACRIGATHVVSFDADGQHSSEDAARMVRRLDAEGLDVVLGTRGWKLQRGMPIGRWALLRAGLLFTLLTTRMRLTDTHNGLRAFTGRAAAGLDLTQDRMAHASEILSRISALGLSWAEEPVAVSYSSETLAKGQKTWGAVSILADLARARLGLAPDRSKTIAVRRSAVERALAGIGDPALDSEEG